jgi:hypothetical protein
MRALLFALALLAPLAAQAQGPAPARPVVVELFTSQGCSSCPPADELLHALAKRGEVLALAFHVTYWDRLGWKDAWSLPEATARQRAYSRLAGSSQIYTPQMMIDGKIDVVGSDVRGVRSALARAAASQAAGPAVSAMRSPEGVAIAVAAGPGSGRVLVVGYDPEHTTRVGRGENAGRTLTEANIVRGLTDAGAWDGTAQRLVVAAPAGERIAVLVQAADGSIIAASVLAAGS